MSMKNRFGSFQNTPFKFFQTPRQPFIRNRSVTNQDRNENVTQGHSNNQNNNIGRFRDNRNEESMGLRERGQIGLSNVNENRISAPASSSFIGQIFDWITEFDFFKNFHLMSTMLMPWRYLTNVLWHLPLMRQMQYSSLLFIVSFFIFYSNLPSSTNNVNNNNNNINNMASNVPRGLNNGRKPSLPTGSHTAAAGGASNSFSFFRLILLLISFLLMMFSMFIFGFALLKYISNYFNGTSNDDIDIMFANRPDLPINMAKTGTIGSYNNNNNNSNRNRQQQPQHHGGYIQSHHHLGSERIYDGLGNSKYEPLLSVPEMRRMKGGGHSGSHSAEQKEFEEHTGLGSFGRRNLQQLSPNRKLALNPNATVDRETMERELNKDALRLDRINQQFGRISPPKPNVGLIGQQSSSNYRDSHHGSHSPRSKTSSPKFTFLDISRMNSTNNSGTQLGMGTRQSSRVTGGSSVGGGTVTSGGIRSGTGGIGGGGAASVAETDLTIAKTMAELRQQQQHHTPIRSALSSMKFTPAPQLLETPMVDKYGRFGSHVHQHHNNIPRSRTPRGTRSRLMHPIDENYKPVPMSIDKSFGATSGGGASMSKDDSFVVDRRFIAPPNVKQKMYGLGSGSAGAANVSHGMANGIGNSYLGNNSNNLEYRRQQEQYQAMLNDPGMYGNVNLRTNRIDANNGLSTLAMQQQQQQQQQHNDGQLEQYPPISPFEPRYQARLPASPFSRRAELDKMNQQQKDNETRYGSRYTSNNNDNKYQSGSSAFLHPQQQSEFMSEYLEKSSKLYENLDIDTSIHHWSSNMRWWMADKLKEKYNNWRQNNEHIIQLFVQLNQWYPNLRQQFSQFQTLQEKVDFVLQNQQKMESVANEKNSPFIKTIVQSRKSIQENANRIDSNTNYIFYRLTQFAQSSNINMFQWNGGGALSNEPDWQPELYPTDSELLMGIFCEYMDAVFCPAFKFSEKNFIRDCKDYEMKELKHFARYFKDIAIVEVLPDIVRKPSNNKNGNDGLTNSYDRDIERDRRRRRHAFDGDKMDDTTNDLPYYFIVYDKEKYFPSIKEYVAMTKENNNDENNNNNNMGGIRKPKHYLASKLDKNKRKSLKSNFEDDYYGKKKSQYENGSFGSRDGRNNPIRKDYITKVGAWYPIPGKDNVFHCLVLFAFFLQKFNDGKLMGLTLSDQNCELLLPLQR